MIIFDEKAYAENLIKNGYKNKKYISYDNIILVKYWKSIGLLENEIKDKLSRFMNEFENLFSSANIVGSKVNKAIEVGMKYDLLTDVVVEITQDELDRINGLETLELRKMMFVFLVVWKFRGMPQRLKITNTDILKLSKVKANNDVFWDYIYGITQSGMLSMVEYKRKSYYRVHMEEHGDVVLHIDKFDDLINYYLSLVEPERYKDCEKCGVPILITTSNNKYCTGCAKKILQKQKNKWKQDNWKKSDQPPKHT